MESQDLDDIIRQYYFEQPLSVDELLCHPTAATEFAELVCAKLETPLPIQDVLHRTLVLRKRGSKKGGLPRRPK